MKLLIGNQGKKAKWTISITMANMVIVGMALCTPQKAPWFCVCSMFFCLSYVFVFAGSAFVTVL